MAVDQLVKLLTGVSFKVTAGVLRRIADAMDGQEAGSEEPALPEINVHIEHYHHTTIPDRAVTMPWKRVSKQ